VLGGGIPDCRQAGRYPPHIIILPFGKEFVKVSAFFLLMGETKD
jgi:hypothetical protein